MTAYNMLMLTRLPKYLHTSAYGTTVLTSDIGRSNIYFSLSFSSMADAFVYLWVSPSLADNFSLLWTSAIPELVWLISIRPRRV